MNNQNLINEAKNTIESLFARFNDVADIKDCAIELIGFLQSYCDKKGLDLEELSKRLNEALNKETSESLNKFLNHERKSAKEIALNFSEKFQKNYPKKPLWKMMVELENDIEVYAQQYQPLTDRVTELEARLYLLEKKSANCPYPKSEKKSAEEILNEKIKANKCHSIDPFDVFEKMTKSALEAMHEYAMQGIELPDDKHLK